MGDWTEARALLDAHSTDLQTALANIDRAEARWRQSLSVLLPNARLTATLAYDLLNSDLPILGAAAPAAAAAAKGDYRPTTPTGVAAASLTQKVVDVGAWRGLDVAEASKRAATADLQAVRRRVTQGLARALVAAVAAERVAEIDRLSLRQALERAALIERVTTLGAGTQLDVVRARQDVAVARGAVVAGDQQLWVTREALGLALGLDHEIGVRPGFALDGLPAELHQQCAALTGDERRAEVLSAEAALSAAQTSTAQARAGYLPGLDLSSTLAAVTASPGLAQVATWSIAATISIPLWEGGLRDGLIRERTAAEVQATAGVEAARRSTTLESVHTRRLLTSAQALLDTTREARELAREQDRLTRRSYEIGRATSLDLVVSAAALRATELNVALREFEFVQAGVDAFLSVSGCK